MAGGMMKFGLIGLLALGASCASHQQDTRAIWANYIDVERACHPEDGGVRSPAVLVTIDGARWQEVFNGEDTSRVAAPRRKARDLFPNLYHLATDRGAMVGAPGKGHIHATGPNFISLPGYTEILTGRSPLACQSNECSAVATPTVLDEAYAAGARVAAFSSWEKLQRAITVAPGRFFVSCGRDGDPTIQPFPGGGEYRPDSVTAYEALRYLAKEQPDVLFVGLGDPDEYAHRGDYEGYVRALSFADAVVGEVFAILDRMGDRGARTNVFVTSDHGRAEDFKNHGGYAPESARVWLFAAGPAITARGRVASSDDRRLADVAPTMRVVLGLESDGSSHAGRPMGELLSEAQPATAHVDLEYRPREPHDSQP